jgi:RNase P subunit RPR2
MESYACANCGVLFSMTADFVRRRREDHSRFFCPAGHGQTFTGENEKERLQREVNALRQDSARLEEWAAAEQRRAAIAEADAKLARKEKARIEKRVQSGVCPDCNRSFVNVARHMTTKHGGQKLKCVGAP